MVISGWEVFRMWRNMLVKVLWTSTLLIFPCCLVYYSFDEIRRHEIKRQKIEQAEQAEFEVKFGTQVFSVRTIGLTDEEVLRISIRNAKVKARLLSLARNLKSKSEEVAKLRDVNEYSDFDTVNSRISRLMPEIESAEKDFRRHAFLAQKFTGHYWWISSHGFEPKPRSIDWVSVVARIESVR